MPSVVYLVFRYIENIIILLVLFQSECTLLDPITNAQTPNHNNRIDFLSYIQQPLTIIQLLKKKQHVVRSIRYNGPFE